PIHIAAPTDPNYAASQLSITVTALPSDGTVLLPGGTTAVTVGETLTVAQLTGLVFKPKTTAAGHISTFAYTVTDPSKLSATGTAALSVTASPDGSALIAGAGGSLVTKAGLWRFSASGNSYGYLILLNGVQAGGGSGTMLEVANQGNLYSENAAGDWYEWVNGGWSATSDPKPAKTTLPLSADGSVLLPGNTGSLVTTAGRWTFSTSTDSYGHLILLNGFSAGGGSGTELEVANQGNLYQKNDVGDWYEWVEGTGWIAAGAPASPAGPPSSRSLTTTVASLTVAENAAATPIGIAAPTDPNYAASQLVVAVTGLPSDGAVLLSGGAAVTVGEKLTVTQLTGLKFKPATGLFGKSSTFTYTVADPAGLSAAGSATLAIGPDTMPPKTTAVSLTVAATAAATPIGIAAPTDPNYA
ncbi:MAG TPA: hypothetical protein VFX03_10450, partial [Thermomicrobiales bacterium]|nr:hypothetical protein [Thermomicrobiales bacterium]